jgi:hypothetical protein
MNRPIPVTECLPELKSDRWGGRESWGVLAYSGGAFPGWVPAVYVQMQNGRSFWEYSAEGVSGHEWEVAEVEDVTHWMDYPPPPSEVV